MRYLLLLLLLLQSPLTLILFISAGADGRRESVVEIYAIMIPILVCHAVLVFRAVRGDPWSWLDWPIAAVACFPAVWLLYMNHRV